jgi:hypothetical protein
MLLSASLALAAPYVPALAEVGPAGMVGGMLDTRSDALVDLECAGESCDALRERTRVGAFIEGQATPWLGGWVAIARETTVTTAALYADTGLAGDGGAWLNLRPQADLGALVWVSGTAGSSGDPAGTHATRWQIESGGAARFGRPDAGIVSCVGANVLVLGNDDTFIHQGTIQVPLAPTLPIEALAGATLYSKTLGGFGSRSRLSFTIEASVGARSGLGAALGLVL